MILVSCLLVLFEHNEKRIFPDAKGYIMEWSEPELYVDFEAFLSSEKVATATYMIKVESNNCVKL